MSAFPDVEENELDKISPKDYKAESMQTARINPEASLVKRVVRELTVDVEGHGGPFARRHRRVSGHAGEVSAAVGVHRRDGQVAPGRHPLPVRQHFLFGKERGSEIRRRQSLGWGAGRRKIKEEEEEEEGRRTRKNELRTKSREEKRERGGS